MHQFSSSQPDSDPVVPGKMDEGPSDNLTGAEFPKLVADPQTPALSVRQPEGGRYEVQTGLQPADSSLIARRPWKAWQGWGLRNQVITWVLAGSMIPVLAVGIATYFVSQPIYRQVVQAKQTGEPSAIAAEEAIRKHLPPLIIGTGLTALLAGVVAAIAANQTLRPILRATLASTHLVNRLRQEEIGTLAPAFDQEELVVLETNLSIIGEQLPSLLWKQEAEAERSQMLIYFIRSLRSALSEEEVLERAADTARQVLKSDRVSVFRLTPSGEGTFVAESVGSDWPKLLWSTLHDPCFEDGYQEQYHQGRVRAIDNIYNAGISDCHIGLLERFAVKANLVAPVLNEGDLLGLLIAHQCSGPRNWQQAEVDLFSQMAIQVGLALDYAKLLEQVDARAGQAQRLASLSQRIRASLNEADILNTTVVEVRKALKSDRVLIYSFDQHWNGDVVAESVLPGFPKALYSQIKDPCFTQATLRDYLSAAVKATPNIYEAGLTDCYLHQLEPFEVKANLVAPILKDDQLFGLLIAHQCSGPRDWQRVEIDFVAQMAQQVGYALDHARLMAQIERDHQVSTNTANEQRQQKEVLQDQVADFLIRGKVMAQTLANETLNQMALLTQLYDHIKAGADAAQELIPAIQQGELQGQQVDQAVLAGYQTLEQVGNSSIDLQETFAKAVAQIEALAQPTQKLDEELSAISNLAAQIRLQAMNVTLEVARDSTTSQEFAAIGEKLHTLVRQLDAHLKTVTPMVVALQTDVRQAFDTLTMGKQLISPWAGWVAEAQQYLNQIATYSDQMKSMAMQFAQQAAEQTQRSTAASQAIVEIADLTSQTSEQSTAVVASFEQLAAMIKEG